MDPNFVWSEANNDWIDINYDPSNPITGDAWNLATTAQSAMELLQQGVTVLNSYQMQQINMERIRKGLPALPASQFAPQVGLNLSASTMQMIMWGAIGIGAIMLLKGRR